MAFSNTVADSTKKKKTIKDLEEIMLSVWEEIHMALEELGIIDQRER